VSTSGPLVAGLLDRRFDFVVARIPPGVPSDALEYREIEDEALGFLVWDSHALLQGPPPDLEAMRHTPWVLQPPGTLLRQEVDALFQTAGLPPPSQIIDTASVMMTLALVAHTDMIAALSREVVDSVLEGSRFRLLPTAPSVPRIAIRRYGLIRLREQPLSPATDAFYAEVSRMLTAVA
jgi:DNA-binding transcriptional LysR family regulator